MATDKGDEGQLASPRGRGENDGGALGQADDSPCQSVCLSAVLVAHARPAIANVRDGMGKRGEACMYFPGYNTGERGRERELESVTKFQCSQSLASRFHVSLPQRVTDSDWQQLPGPTAFSIRARSAGGTSLEEQGGLVANGEGVLSSSVAIWCQRQVHRDPTTPPPLWSPSDDVLARGPERDGGQIGADAMRGTGINKPRPPLGDAATQAWLVLIAAGLPLHMCSEKYGEVCLRLPPAQGSDMLCLPVSPSNCEPAKHPNHPRRHNNRTQKEAIHLHGYCSITSVPLPTIPGQVSR